ncbi:MAG TPA: hypothetical protein VMS01_04265 [Stellaceae bacterium]|nr:hypothetical protein [Stellaceae bacterium]
MSLFTDIEYFTATIQSGQTVSNAVQIGKKTLVGVVTPSGWTTATIAFQASPDAANFYPVNNFAFTGVLSGSITASQFIEIDPTQWRGIDTLKLVSGASQGSTVNVTLVVRGVT